MGERPPELILAQLIVIFFSIGLHEFAHCKFADLAGDPTPRYYGRVTLNLFKHFDPVGSMLIILTTFAGFGIGWGRPAPMDPSKMRDPRWDWFIAVIAGPLTNVLIAVVCGVILRICIHANVFYDSGSTGQFFLLLLTLGVFLNLGLAMFNMFPIGLLDGKWIIGLLMPERARYSWFKFNQQYGIVLVVGFVILMQTTNLSSVIWVPALKGFRLITGFNFE